MQAHSATIELLPTACGREPILVITSGVDMERTVFSDPHCLPYPGQLYTTLAHELDVVEVTYKGVTYPNLGQFLVAWAGECDGGDAVEDVKADLDEAEPPAPYSEWCEDAYKAIGL